MLFLIGFELYSRWVPLTTEEGEILTRDLLAFEQKLLPLF